MPAHGSSTSPLDAGPGTDRVSGAPEPAGHPASADASGPASGAATPRRPVTSRVTVVLATAVVLVVCVLHGVAFLRSGPGAGGGPMPAGLPLTMTEEMVVVGVALLLVVLAVTPRAAQPSASGSGATSAPSGATPAPSVAATPSGLSAGAPPAPSSGAARRWVAVAVLALALVIDISKTSTLGFVIPGMSEEYGLTPGQASMLPVAGLVGATVGSLMWGVWYDRLGSRVSLLLAGLGFTATSLCGSMPTYPGNLVMCFLMGWTVGGLVPVVFALLADLFDARRAATVGVLLAGVGAAGGYLLASWSARWFADDHGWRVLWILGCFTGALLVALVPLVPEGRVPEPKKAGAGVARRWGANAPLVTYGLMTGFVTLGVVTWLPSMLREHGLDPAAADALLSRQALWTLPVVLAVALALRVQGSHRVAAVLACAAGAAVVLVGVVVTSDHGGLLLSVGVGGAVLLGNAMLATVLPATATWLARDVRGHGTGLVAAASKTGGVVGPPVLGAALGTAGTLVLATSAVGVATAASGLWVLRAAGGPGSADDAAAPEAERVEA